MNTFTCSPAKFRSALGYLCLASTICTLTYTAYAAFHALSSNSSDRKDKTKDPPNQSKLVKPIITLCLTELALWNPSIDPHSPNFAFARWDDLATLLSLIRSQKYQLHLVACAISSEEQKDIMRLLVESGCICGPSEASNSKLNSSRIHFYLDETDKDTLIDMIAPLIHVEAVRPIQTTSTNRHALAIGDTIQLETQTNDSSSITRSQSLTLATLESCIKAVQYL